MRQDFAGTPQPTPQPSRPPATPSSTSQEWTFNLGPGFVVGVGNGLLLGYMMYRHRPGPRGHGHARPRRRPLIVLSGTAVLLGVIEPARRVKALASIPEFFWELMASASYLDREGLHGPLSAIAPPRTLVEPR